MKKLLIACLLISLTLPALSLAESPLYVHKIENLPDDFILGMDVSSVLALESCGVKYYDHDGRERDLFDILAENGVNYIRVRVWNDPFTADGKGYGGGNCTIDTAVEIGKRATKAGMKLLVDFHYSDFWADPAKQMAPKAWAKLGSRQKPAAVYEYTRSCLQKLKDAGVQVGMVQLGNETNGMFCGEKNWVTIVKLMASGARAVREIDPGILIAVHFANPENGDQYQTYAAKLQENKLDYDVFASSYYPYWHGTIDNLKTVLSGIASAYNKKVMIAETSYAYTAEDTDFSGNTIGEGGNYAKPYPFSVQGQANEVADVIRAMCDIGGIGVFYWEGAWITAGGATWAENAAYWENNGAGWAASHAAEYDPDDAGKYYGGCACDNQAMFGPDGKALESLKVFRLIKEGNIVPVKAEAIDDVHLIFDLNSEITLPENVDVVMNDGSRQSLPVAWDSYDAAAMKNGGAKDYLIRGAAGGMEAVCHVSMVEYNFLKNYSFEEKDESMWTVCNLGQTEQLYVEDKLSDSLTGTKHYHFYSAAADSVRFTLEQEVHDLPAGLYRYQIGIMGGDGGTTDIYSYVKINGETVAVQPAEITVYNSWDTPVIEGISVKEGDKLTVGLYVSCQGAGAWGKIDDVLLNSQKQ